MKDIANLEKQGPVQDYNAKGTIAWQAITGILCLVIAGSMINLLTFLSNQLEIYWLDNSKHSFFIGAMFSSLSLIFLVVYVTKKQFENAFDSGDVLFSSLQYTFWTWVCITILYLGLMFLGLLFGIKSGFLVIVADLTFLLVSLTGIGMVISLVQVIRLEIEDFDPIRHRKLISNEADVLACKLGVLPYRSRVRAFWNGVFLLSIGLVFIAGGFTTSFLRKGNPLGFFLGLGMGLVGVYRGISFFSLLVNPSLASVEDQVSDKTIWSYRGFTYYHLICNNEKYMTNSQTWKGIVKGGSYRLWYSSLNRQVVAFETLTYPVK